MNRRHQLPWKIKTKVPTTEQVFDANTILSQSSESRSNRVREHLDLVYNGSEVELTFDEKELSNQMPMHDWTQVPVATYHSFHTIWIGEIARDLNNGTLPDCYYAEAEQASGNAVADVLSMKHSPSFSPPTQPGIATRLTQAQKRKKPRVSPRLSRVYF